MHDSSFIAVLHKLDGYRLPQEAAAFIRGPKNSDINTLTEIVSLPRTRASLMR